MEEIKKKIADSGLRKSHIAKKLGISGAHFSMMLGKKANMPEETRNKLTSLLNRALQLS